jgi:hypothetical protein
MLTPLACALMELKRSLRDFVPSVLCALELPSGDLGHVPPACVDRTSVSDAQVGRSEDGSVQCLHVRRMMAYDGCA